MRIIDLAIKDLLQIVRDWKAAFFLIAMPVGFTLLFGFIFTEQATNSDEEMRLSVAVLDQDNDLLGIPIYEMLTRSESIHPERIEAGEKQAELKKQIEDGELAAAIIIPMGYTTAVQTGDIPKLDVIINTESGAGTTAQWAIQGVVSRVIGAVSTAQFSTQIRSEIKSFSDEEEKQAYFTNSLKEAVSAWDEPPATLVSSFTGQDSSGEQGAINAFTHSSPGMMVQFAIAGLIGAAEILVLERKSGSLRRLLTTPIRRYEVLLGHFLAMVIMILTQFVILILFAQIFLDVPYLREPLATFLIAFATATFAAAMGLLISTLAKTAEQVVVFSLIPMFILSGLGGTWVPLEFTGETFQKIAYLTPMAWSMTGFKNIIERGQGLESVLIPIGILLSFAVILFGLAAWLFKFEEA